MQLTRRVLVMSAIRDTQCGFKVFRDALARDVFSQTRISSFAFDIEVLFVARKLGARIVEMPVRTTYRDESTLQRPQAPAPVLARHRPDPPQRSGRACTTAKMAGVHAT